MKKDTLKGKANALLEKFSAWIGHYWPLTSFVVRWLWRRLLPKPIGKKIFIFRHSRRKKDGSGTDTEIHYTEES